MIWHPSDRTIPPEENNHKFLHRLLSIGGGVALGPQRTEDLDKNNPVDIDIVHRQNMFSLRIRRPANGDHESPIHEIMHNNRSV